MDATAYYAAMARIRELRAMEHERGLTPNHYNEMHHLIDGIKDFELREFVMGRSRPLDLGVPKP